jgi:hypothetical protein
MVSLTPGRGQLSRAHGQGRPLFIGACSPYLDGHGHGIPTQRDHVDGDTPRRGRARIADSAIAARFGRFADCPASATLPCDNGWDILSPDFAPIDIGEVASAGLPDPGA